MRGPLGRTRAEHRALIFCAVTLGVVVATACGSGGSGDGSSSGGGSSSGTTSTSSGDPSSSSGTLPGTSSGVPADLTGCAKDTITASVQPLDVLVLFDTSDSMNDQVAQGVSKFKAVSDAVNSFLTDKRSAGIGAGLTFFPVDKVGTPASCSLGSCPAGSGPCSIAACDQPGPLYFCDDKSMCANGKQCTTRGRCQYGQNTYCSNIGGPCGVDSNGFDRGTCLAQAAPWCTKSDSLTSNDYKTPVLPIAPLPGSAAAFANALATHKLPQGETPTYCALQGAYAALQDWHTAHPDHALAVLLATDGGPDECNPFVDATQNQNAFKQLAGAALASPAQIRTFVVGLFGTVDGPIAKPYMDAIAQGGGTNAPYIITPNATTTTAFLDALNQVRGAALPCDYAIPAPEAGTADFTKLNVQYTPDGQMSVVYPNRKDAATCDQNGGWYYDVDPATAAPTKAILCPVTCSAVNTQSGRMDVVLGCQTIVR